MFCMNQMLGNKREQDKSKVSAPQKIFLRHQRFAYKNKNPYALFLQSS